MLNTYEKQDIDKYNGVQKNTFRVYINNVKKNRADNIDTFLVDTTERGNLIVAGNINYIKKDQLILVGEEVMRVVGYVKNGKNTQLRVERGVDSTPTTKLLKGDIVCSVDDITDLVTYYTHSSKMDLQDNPFNVYYGTGAVKIKDDIKKWNGLSNKHKQYNYTLYKSKIFIFEGYDDSNLLTFRGYLKKVSFSKTLGDKHQITFNLVDQLGSYWNKDLKVKKFFKDVTIRELISEIFEIHKNKIYYKHIEEKQYPKVFGFTMNDLKTYQEVVNILSNNGIRFAFTPRGHIHIFSEIVGDNGNLSSNILLDDVHSLVDISLTDDSQLIFNYGKIEFTQQFPYYELTKGVNYLRHKRIMVSNPILQKLGEHYYVKEFTVTDSEIASKVSLDVYGTPSVCMLKHPVNGIEILCNPTLISASQVIFVPVEILSNTGLLEFGKGKWLMDNGFGTQTQFDFYYVQGNLPTVFALSKTEASNKSSKTNQLEVPITPIIMEGNKEFINLNKKLTLQFGSPRNLKDLEYTGSYENLEKIVGKWVGGKDLLYEKEWEQSQKGLDVFVNATSLSDRNKIKNGLPHYDTFDNSGLTLHIQNLGESNSEIVSQFVNTKVPTLELNKLPKIDFKRGEIVGDIAVRFNERMRYFGVAPNDVLFPVRVLEGATLHEKLKFEEMKRAGIEIRCTAVSNYENEVLYHFNNPLFLNIEYAKIPCENIIYVQNYYIKANPIVKKSEFFYHTDRESIELYDGKKSFSIDTTIFDNEYTKKILSYVFNTYKGTSTETMKYVIPITTVKSIELELYDLVRVKDEVITDIDVNNLFMVIGKTITFDTSRKIEYTLLNLYTKDYEMLDLNYSQIEKFNPLTDVTYNHLDVEFENKDISGYLQRIELKDNKYGKIIAELVKFNNARIFVLPGSRDPLLFVDLRGEKQYTYGDSLFPTTLFETFFIVNIGKEYLYVSPVKVFVSEGVHQYRLQVMKRQLGNSPKEDVLVGREGAIYIIAEGTTKDYSFKTSSIYVGDGKNKGFLSYDPVEGLKLKADKVEILSEGGKDPMNIATAITQTSDRLSFEVNRIDEDFTEKKEVISVINLSQEGINIKGKHIDIDGETTFFQQANFLGGVRAKDSIMVYSGVEGNSDQRTILGAGGITFEEKNTMGQWITTRAFRKFACGISTVGFKIIEYKDLRQFTGGVTWKGNIKLIYSVTSLKNLYKVKEFKVSPYINPKDKHLIGFTVDYKYIDNMEEVFTRKISKVDKLQLQQMNVNQPYSVISENLSSVNIKFNIFNAYYSHTRKGSRRRSGKHRYYDVFFRYDTLIVISAQKMTGGNWTEIGRYTSSRGSFVFSHTLWNVTGLLDAVLYRVKVDVYRTSEGYQYNDNGDLEGYLRGDNSGGLRVEIQNESREYLYDRSNIAEVMWLAYEE